MRILQLPLSSGGYNVANIPLYYDLLFLKSIYAYCKHREQKTHIYTNSFHWITLVISFHLSIYRLPFRNSFPHSLTTSPFYSYALALCKKCRFTFEQLSQGKAKKLYKLLTTPKYAVCNANTWAPQTNWKNIHNGILSNHFKTFNYRCVWDNLPALRKFCLNPLGFAGRLHLLSCLPRNANSLINRMRLFPTHLAIHRSSHTTNFQHETPLDSTIHNLHGCTKTGKIIHGTHCVTNYHRQTHTLENKKPSPLWRKTDHSPKGNCSNQTISKIQIDVTKQTWNTG